MRDPAQRLLVALALSFVSSHLSSAVALLRVVPEAHLANIGRRNAIECTAHFFMELAERLSLVGLATEAEFKCPLSQFVLADALGLTAVLGNRVLRQLREQELLTLQRGSVKIHDLNGLRKLARFQGGYLNSRD